LQRPAFFQQAFLFIVKRCCIFNQQAQVVLQGLSLKKIQIPDVLQEHLRQLYKESLRAKKGRKSVINYLSFNLYLSLHKNNFRCFFFPAAGSIRRILELENTIF